MSRPPGHVEPYIDPTHDDIDEPGSSAAARESRDEASHDDWLQEQRPPHWE